jgi:hypothetical protein
MKGLLVPTICTVLLFGGLNASQALGQTDTAETQASATRTRHPGCACPYAGTRRTHNSAARRLVPSPRKTV